MVDLAILAAVGFALFSGYKRGAVLQVFSWGGFVLGIITGGVIGPPIVRAINPSSPAARALVALAAWLGTAFIIEGIVAVVGSRLVRKITGARIKQVDAAFGSAIAAVLALLAVWLISVPAKQNPTAAKLLKGSVIVRGMYDIMPNPPNIMAGIGGFLSHTGFPEVFAQFNPSLAPEVSPPPASLRNDPKVLAAARFTYKISSVGCDGIVNGSGFPVGERMVITAAHVVAGTRRTQVLEPSDGGSGRYDARVVYIDTDRDIAVLYVPQLESELIVSRSRASRGTDGAAIGYPGGGARKTSVARVRTRTPATGRDIYSRKLVERTIYVLYSSVHQGNSGGPFVDTQGRVRGMIFAASAQNENEAYALAEDEIFRAVRAADGKRRSVDTHQCAI